MKQRQRFETLESKILFVLDNSLYANEYNVLKSKFQVKIKVKLILLILLIIKC